MNLQPKYFDFMKEGPKRIELRLYDEKRSQIELGDIIEFSKSENDKLKAEVIGLLRYNSGHDGGVLSTNIPNDGTYLDWTTIVDADGHVIPVPVDTNVKVN